MYEKIAKQINPTAQPASERINWIFLPRVSLNEAETIPPKIWNNAKTIAEMCGLIIVSDFWNTRTA